MAASKTSGAGSILGAVLLIFLAYIAGRWQINKAGDVIDAQFTNHPRAVAGATTLAGAVFSNDILGGHPLTALMAGGGLLLIAQDLLYNVGSEPIKTNLNIDGNATAELDGGAPYIMTS